MSRAVLRSETPSLVGRSVPRQDAREKVTGAATYVADLHLPGMLYGRALRAEHPHARILAIDPRAARELEGVAAVLTAADVPGVNRFGRVTADQPVLADGKVRYLGDVVALVAAETPEAAERALGLVRVRYEPLPAVFDPLEAMAEGAPKVHDGRDNVLAHVKIRKGDVDAAFAAAEVVVEGTYTTPTVDHLYLEPEGAVAVPAPDGGITVWAPTQAPFTVRAAVAQALGLPAHRVKVVQTTAGGGFGGKVDAAMDTCARAALLAQATGRPVRLIYGRRESLLGSGKRHAAVVRHRLAASRDGRLLGVDIQVYLNKGAYASVGGVEPPAGGLTVKSAVHAAGPYEIPNVRVDAYNVYTNLPYGSPMRGYGVPQVCFATESQVDDLAYRLGMDPLELRRLNGFRLGSATATGQVLDQSVGYQETLRRAAEAAGWTGGRRPEAPRRGTGRRAGGTGAATSFFAVSSGRGNDFATAYIFLTGEGRIEVRTGLVELGQGSRTVLAQLAAEALGVPLELVSTPEPDTAVDPDSLTTTASRGATLGGNAVLMAARAARETLGRLGGAPGAPGELPLAELGRRLCPGGRLLIGQGQWRKPTPTFDPETGQGQPYHVYTYATQIADVEVDLETGEVEVLRVVAAHDVGRAINPALVGAQIQGGVSMGVGYALYEDLRFREGRMQNPDLTDYVLPTSVETPAVVPVIVEEPNEMGPFGGKGIGEPPVIPTAPAIANAIFHATGARVRALPITPERVLDALREASGGGNVK